MNDSPNASSGIRHSYNVAPALPRQRYNASTVALQRQQNNYTSLIINNLQYD